MIVKDGLKIYDIQNPLAKKVRKLEKQRDNLLEACKASLTFCRGLVGKHPAAKILREQLGQAIAKAEGVKNEQT